MLLATLYTNTAKQLGGYYELEVSMPRKDVNKSAVPRMLVMWEIKKYLISAVMDTQIPMDRWSVKFSPEVQRAFNLPEIVNISSIDPILN